MTNNHTIEDQISLELEMRVLTVTRHMDNVRGSKERHEESGTNYGNILLKGCVDAVAKGLIDFMDQAETGGAGRRHSALKFLKMFDPHVVALITGRIIIDKITFRDTTQKVAIGIGTMLESEARYIKFSTEAAPLFRKVNDSITTNHTAHKKKILNLSMNRAGIEWDGWTTADKLHLGMKCIEVFIETTGMAELVYRIEGKNDSKSVIEATPKTLAWINRNIEHSALLMPVYLPTIIPPRDWTSPTEGGYHSDRCGYLHFIKTRNKRYLEEVSNHPEQMAPVYAGVNAMQKTAWRINTQVLDVLCDVWSRGLSLGKLPSREDIAIIPCPLPKEMTKEEMTEDQLNTLRSWKRGAAETHEANSKTRSRRILVAKVISIAQRFKQYEEIFFPYNVDFRGRVYAIPLFLNPQGADCAKGLSDDCWLRRKHEHWCPECCHCSG